LAQLERRRRHGRRCLWRGGRRQLAEHPINRIDDPEYDDLSE
jgi:hypothetical protein